MDQNQLHKQYLEAMGIQQWVPRFVDNAVDIVSEGSSKGADESAFEVDAQGQVSQNQAMQEQAMQEQASELLASAANKEQIDVAVQTPQEPLSQEPLPQEPLLKKDSNTPISHDFNDIGDLQQLRQVISNCAKCEIAQERTNTVFGVGNPNADLMIIGEAPGADEDRQGKPFVGKAGQLLNKMLSAIGLSRNQVFIANILKCRPTNNRDPQKHEIANCQGYLNKQIELIQPKVILSVGRVSAQSLLNLEIPISKLRGKPHEYGDKNIPLVATFHPAYLLRSPAEKAKAWDDLKFVQFLLNQPE